MNAYYFFKSKWFEWLEQKKIEKEFYHHTFFREQDKQLLATYQKKSPYQISKEYWLKKEAKNPYVYGETPLTTMEKIVTECALTKHDQIIEMGAGRGRAALFLASYIGCKVVAYEKIPFFVEKIGPVPNLIMVSEDMFSADFSKATAIYLYGTMLEDFEVFKLTEKFPLNAKIITVSYPLKDYNRNYVTKKTFSGHFPWGKTEIFWNERIV